MAFKVETLTVLLALLSVATCQEYSWTAWFSEEEPDGQNCMVNQSVAAFRCSGQNCDKMQMGCLDLPTNTYLNYLNPQWLPYWSRYASDDTIPPYVECDWGTKGLAMGLIFGMKASGFESDIISIHCAPLGTGSFHSCDWTAPFSEDEGQIDFPEGYYATGVQCDGRQCGTLSFRICKIQDNTPDSC